MSNNPRKCPHCKKIFFDYTGNIIWCPFCNQNITALSDFFGDIFGNQNNPFSDFMNHNNGETDDEKTG